MMTMSEPERENQVQSCIRRLNQMLMVLTIKLRMRAFLVVSGKRVISIFWVSPELMIIKKSFSTLNNYRINQ